MAKLTFIYGAMNSGKSDSLIKTAYNYSEQGLNVVTIKPAADTKSKLRITARAGGSRLVDIIASADTDLEAEVLKLAKNKKLNCVLVDEAQFLNPAQIDQLYRTSKLSQISVVAFGLRTDFKTKLFAGSKRLLEIADSIEKLVTMCRCGEQAEFNCRFRDEQPVFDGDQIAIDGKSKTSYSSLCGACYHHAKLKSSNSKKVSYV